MSAGRRLAGPRVILYVRPGPARTVGTSAAPVAGRRVGGAVERNRARRILRAAWRQLAPGVEDGLHVVMVARGSILEARTQELVTEMQDLLSRAGVFGG